MLNLTQDNFKKIRDKLLHQQKIVEEELSEIEKDDPVKSDGLAESMESGTESWMADVHGRAVAVSDNLHQMSDNIKKALNKLKSGKYGKCESCGKQIEVARLIVMPTATLCMACSKKTPKPKA